MNAQLSHQTAVQGAVARVSVIKQVADAVLGSCEGHYLSSYELYLKPAVRPLVRDANHLAIVLSDAYKSKLLGRIHAPEGKHKYAYGPTGMTAEGTKRSRKVINPKEPKEIAYAASFETRDPVSVLNLIRLFPDIKWTNDDGLYALTKEGKPEDVLRFLIDAELLQDGVTVNMS